MKSACDRSTNQSADRQLVRHSLGDVGAPITVVVADDHPVVRQGLTEILNSQNDIKVIAEAADGEEACQLYNQLLPDVLMLDLRLPKKDGLQVLLELMSRRVSRPRVVIMTTYDCEQDVCRAARAGAKAFLVKVAGAQQIREAIRRVAEGETFFSPEIGLKLAESLSHPELSKREIQVLQHLACGKSNKEIGCALYVCEGTTKSHIRSIFRKLNALGRAEAIAIAARRGLLQVVSFRNAA